MEKSKVKKPSLKDLFDEVRALRREITMFLPTESLAEFANPKRIMASYKKAVAKYPTHESYQNS
jgi:hypothetical protein